MARPQHDWIKACAGFVLSAALLVACAAPTPTPMPAPSIATPDPSVWLRAPDIEQPTGFLTPQTGIVTTRGCAPCHPAIDTLMTGVAAGPGGLVAVGWVLQDFLGASWRSTDGASWAFTGGFPTQSLLSAVAANDHRYVAVGLAGKGSTVWSSTDGSTWAKTDSPAFGAAPLRITSVTPWHGGFVAGGYNGTEFFSADATAWVSPDGLAWRQATNAPDLQGARIWGVAANSAGIVAVGQSGPADALGPAAVWTSPDGLTWSRVADGPVFRNGRMRAIAAVPSIGFVAVGEDLAGDTGIVWLSPDGRTWSRAPADATFGRPGIQLRIYSVTVGPNGVVAAGTLTEGLQYGAAAVWTSHDGLAWQREPAGTEFLDTEINATTIWHDRIVAVGDRGAPDAYQATAWLSPVGVGP